MQQFVFWTGVYNLIVGSVFLIPGSTNIVGIDLLIGLAYLIGLPRPCTSRPETCCLIGEW